MQAEDYADERVRVITLSGNLCRNMAAELSERLLSALGNADYLVLRLQDIRTIEAEYLSQICTAYKLALRIKKKMIMTGDLQGVREYVKAERNAVCAARLLAICADQCIWRMPGTPVEVLKEN